MSFRPALVDRQGGPITGKAGGPMSLAKPAINWSHGAGKRHIGLTCPRVDRGSYAERPPERVDEGPPQLPVSS